VFNDIHDDYYIRDTEKKQRCFQGSAENQRFFEGGFIVRIGIFEDKNDLGRHAAAVGAEQIRRALKEKGRASIIVATGASQFEMLDALVNEGGIDWKKVRAFHLDEYVGISAGHKASFRKYLRERFEEKVAPLNAFFYIEGDAPDTAAELRRISRLITDREIDVAFIGIGENGHLAFNDPPADLSTPEPYRVVELDEACRKQQVGEGWFASLGEVPLRAISMSIPQILKSRCIICTVPDSRKAAAAAMALYSPIDPQYPCAVLRNHGNCYLLVDRFAATGILARP
jgi:glucosamine-6-phosphate deaminase